MAGSGARVLQLRSVEFARNHGVAIHVRSTFSDSEGTWIREDGTMEDAIISGITHTTDEVYVTLTDVPDKPGTAASIFNAVAAAHINVDTIIQNAVTHGDADVTFSIPTDDLPLMRDTIDGLCRDLGLHWRVDETAAKVSLIGAGMKSHPGVAAKMFQTLADERDQRAHDRDLADQGVVRDPPRHAWPTRCRRCTRRSSPRSS